jgi:Ca2+/H+ antiporter
MEQRPGAEPPESADQVRLDLCGHIFAVSAGLVGVCLTVIGLIRIVQELQDFNSIAGELLAGDALVFLVACTLAYLTLRSQEGTRRRSLERGADACFLIGLAVMVAVCGVVAYALF